MACGGLRLDGLETWSPIHAPQGTATAMVPLITLTSEKAANYTSANQKLYVLAIEEEMIAVSIAVLYWW